MSASLRVRWRWPLLFVILSIALFFVLRSPPVPPPLTTPAPAVIAPASQPIAAKPIDAPAPEPPPLATLPPNPQLSAGFCDPPGEAAIARTLKANEASDLRRAFTALHTSAFATAAPLFDGYLAAHGNDAQIARVRSRLRAQIDVQEGFSQSTRGTTTLAYPDDALPAPEAWTLAGNIDDALDEAARLTGTERRRALYAVAYRDRSELLAVTCVPSWAVGVYDGTLRLALDTMKSEAERDRELRHEALHAQLGPVLSGAPRWWDEGLAQYFEEHGKLGWNGAFQAMLRNKTYIPFKSLEGSFFVFEANMDAALAYEQSHAMVQLLVDRNGEAVIARAIELLRAGTKKEALLSALDPSLTEADLLALLERKRPK